jgi:hypothetical protein
MLNVTPTGGKSSVERHELAGPKTPYDTPQEACQWAGLRHRLKGWPPSGPPQLHTRCKKVSFTEKRPLQDHLILVGLCTSSVPKHQYLFFGLPLPP